MLEAWLNHPSPAPASAVPLQGAPPPKKNKENHSADDVS